MIDLERSKDALNMNLILLEELMRVLRDNNRPMIAIQTKTSSKVARIPVMPLMTEHSIPHMKDQEDSDKTTKNQLSALFQTKDMREITEMTNQ
jgi:hypothetical protein